VRKGVVGDLVAGGDDGLEQRWVGRGVPADGAERHMHLFLREDGEQLGRLDRVGAVVEDHGDVDRLGVGGVGERGK
jgi:hypothetical protein